MKRYLFSTLPSNDLGLLTRSLPIAHELRRRGHRVLFCSPGSAPKKLITDAGFENLLPRWPLYQILGGDIGLSSLARILGSRSRIGDLKCVASYLRNVTRFATSEIWNVDQFMHLMGMGDERLVRLTVDCLIGLIRESRPDAVVDFWNSYMCIAARATRTPLFTVIQADLHPQSSGFIWWKEHPPGLPTPVPAVNSVLAELHLQPVTTTGELLIGNRTFVVGIPEMDPLPKTTEVTYIGSVLWQKPGDILPTWIARLPDEPPVVWVYPGNTAYQSGTRTAFDSKVVLDACIEALANEAVQVVLTAGHHSLGRKAISLPANFRHVSYVPGLAMAERSQMLIHHGGYGSSQTGLVAGKPALIIPTYSERESNARRIAAQGAGDFILPESDASGKIKRVSAQEVHDKAMKILSEPSFAENARRIREKMQQYGGAPYAAYLIERQA